MDQREIPGYLNPYLRMGGDGGKVFEQDWSQGPLKKLKKASEAKARDSSG